MTADFIDASGRIPLEREYEAWIANAIERYFLMTRHRVSLFAVSPADEVSWPADEALATAGKVVGFQFKSPKLSLSRGASGSAPDALHWGLHQPPGQFELLIAFPEIFYCLPTFTNRRYRHVALHHCLFWRPPNKNKMAWYDNQSPRVRTRNKKLSNEMRWGYFVEQMLYCDIGTKMTLPPAA